MKLPLPRYIIFYNGLKEEPDRLELKLSDAFLGDGKTESCLEFKALLLNINLGHNQELMERCGELRGYAVFVASVRGYLSWKMDLEEAVDCAVEECISKGILSKFLAKHRAEVQDLILQEYNEQEHIEMEREEARQEGREEGIQALILDNLEEGTPKEKIIDKVSRRFLLGKEEAAVFYEKYAVEDSGQA